jgi:SAM-dependent methyltransferase
MLETSGRFGGRALDVGCGPGTNAALFVGWDYVGVDLNEKYISTARAIYPPMRFEVGDATKLDIGGKFDVVLINSLMHHIDDAGCLSLLGGLSNLLNDGGSVITQEPLIPEDGNRLQTFFMNQDRGDYFRTTGHWQKLFDDGGFRIDKEEFYTMKLAGFLVGWRMYSALLTRK